MIAGVLLAVLSAQSTALANSPAPEAPPEGTIWNVPIGHAIGVLAGMRLSLSLIWPGPYDPTPFGRSASRFGDAYTRPPEYNGRRTLLESDNDPWLINTVGHGLFGAEIYGRVRQCGGSAAAAFAFAVGTSAVWEYGVESFSKRPSALDLVATPIIGAILGEGRFHLQRWLRTRPRSTSRKILEVVIDPLGELERGVFSTRC